MSPTAKVLSAYTACMGGFCRARETCQHHQTMHRGNPHERLCAPGGSEHYLPVGVGLPAEAQREPQQEAA